MEKNGLTLWCLHLHHVTYKDKECIANTTF
jgi:hypothetical protein